MRRTARMPFAAVAASLALAFLLAPRPTAAHTIEGLTSTIFQKDQSSFSGIGIRMRVQLQQLAEGFSVAPAIAYWRNQSKVDEFDIQVTRKDAMLGGML